MTTQKKIKSNKIFRKIRSKRQSGGVLEGIQEEKNTALLDAVLHNLFDEANDALEQGADVNTRYSRGGTTPLMVAAAYGQEEIVELLLKWKANVNLTSTLDNYTALMFASENDQLGIADLLLINGANVNAINDEGDTAIILAAAFGNEEIVELLLDEGATNVNAKNKYGVTALEVATKNRHTKIVKLLKKAIEIEKNKQEAMIQVENRDNKIPSLRTLIHRQLPTHPTIEINEYDFMLPPSKLGGKRKKRKTKKSKKTFKKTRSKKTVS